MPEYLTIHAAVAKAISGEDLTDAEKRDAATGFATDLVGLCFALRDAANRHPASVVEGLRAALGRKLTLASVMIDSVAPAILRTRTAVFRSGGKIAPTAHEMAKSLGWLCRNGPENDSSAWPDKDELLAEIKLEHSRVELTTSVEIPPPPPTPPLTETEVKLIVLLQKNHSRLMLVTEMEAEREMPTRKTLGLALKHLSDLGLVHQPKRGRRGYAITPDGVKVFQSLQQPR